jgi:2,4-dienoyl-CoA reductase-like NADH-dependent reductase (Old Yellow Enzyme family)
MQFTRRTDAAELADATGFDAVELHLGHNHSCE